MNNSKDINNENVNLENNTTINEETKADPVTENQPKTRKPRAKKQSVDKADNNEKLVLAKSIASRGQKVAKTYAGIEDSFIRTMKMFSYMFDRFVFNPKWSVLVSLILAVFVFLTVTNGWVTNNVLPYADALDVKLKIVANEEVYEISGLPESVEVIVRGEMSDVQLTKTTGGYNVVADLSMLSEGTHTVNFVATDFSDRVSTTINPASAEVVIRKRISKQFDISYDFINTDKMDSRFILSTPEFETNDVIVRASQETVDKIAMIKALIDVNNIDGSFEQYATLVAYDNQGNKVDANMLPSSVKVNVEVTSPSKSLPIVIVPRGELPNGKAIESITMDHEAITIYAPESVLNAMENFIVTIDVSSMVSDSSIVAIITLPSGVKESSISKVNLEVKLCDAETRTIDDILLIYRNLPSGLRFTLSDPEDVRVSVEVIGSPEAIASINPDDITAYLDFSKATVGTFPMSIYAEGNNYLVKYVPTKEAIEVQFIE